MSNEVGIVGEPVIILPAGTAHSRGRIEHCRWRIEKFVRFDAYAGYDYTATGLGGPQDVITVEHIRLVNRAMMARSPYAAWEPLFGQVIPGLSRIPRDLDLVDGGDTEIDAALAHLEAAVATIASRECLTDMAASKALFLLRPRFVAISDSYVRGCLGIADGAEPTPSKRGRHYAARMIAVQRGIQALGRRNSPALDALHQWANSLPPTVPQTGQWAGGRIPVVLSKARILDILLRTEVAIFGSNPHPRWSVWYRDEVDPDYGTAARSTSRAVTRSRQAVARPTSEVTSAGSIVIFLHDEHGYVDYLSKGLAFVCNNLG